MSILKKSTLKLWLRHFILAAIFIVAVIFLALQLLKIWTNHGEHTVVPDLSKMTLSEVAEAVDKANLRYEVIDSATYNPKYPRYSVIEQSPKAATKVKEDRKIYLTINPSGYRKVTVPRVIQITRRSAEATLKAVGLEVGEITYVDNIGKDMVLEMTHEGKKIEPGEQLAKTSVINLVCGNGINPLLPKEIIESITNSNSEESQE